MKKIPLTIKVNRFTDDEQNLWYKELIGLEFTVIDSGKKYFYVDEYDITPTACIPYKIKKSDCEILKW